jgi:hypothetical protein
MLRVPMERNLAGASGPRQMPRYLIFLRLRYNLSLLALCWRKVVATDQCRESTYSGHPRSDSWGRSRGEAVASRYLKPIASLTVGRSRES